MIKKLIDFLKAFLPNTWELDIDPDLFCDSRVGSTILNKIYAEAIEARSIRSEIRKKDWCLVYVYPKEFLEIQDWLALIDFLIIKTDSIKIRSHKIIIKLLPKNLDVRNLT